jgi:hypothetical protein
VCRQTIGKIYYFIREIIGSFLCFNASKIGGLDENNNPKTIEIDESFFKKENTTGDE